MKSIGTVILIALNTWCAASLSLSDDWELLGDVEVKRVYDDFLDLEVEKPEFSAALRERDQTNIQLEGFVIPLNELDDSDYFVLSRFPFQSCFFCGNAGPETVVEVYATKKLSLRDQRVKVAGVLYLNDDDPLHLYYIMRNATVEILE